MHSSFTALTGLAGLSLSEAADFLGVSAISANSWSSGRRNYKPAVIDKLKDLVAFQESEAARHLSLIRRAMAAVPKQPVTSVYLMSGPRDDEHAKRMGYPCVGAWRAMAGRVVAAAPVKVNFGDVDMGLVNEPDVTQAR